MAIFSPDGNLYVARDGTGLALRYKGKTGAFIDGFAATGTTGTDADPYWMKFGTDGYLYATAATPSTGSDTSLEAGAMGLSKATLARDLFFASLSSPLGVEAGIHGICLPQQYLAYRD